MNTIFKNGFVIAAIAILVGSFYSFTYFDSGESPVKGWFIAGSNRSGYEIDVVKDADRNQNVAVLKSKKGNTKKGFGTMMQTFSAKKYLGKKLKLTAFIKTSDVNDWVGMWMRVDGEKGKMLSFDNMQERSIKGTTGWKKYEIILDVPKSSSTINYGVLLSGTGVVWMDNFSFQEVSSASQSTGKEYKEEPTNTSFED